MEIMNVLVSVTVFCCMIIQQPAGQETSSRTVNGADLTTFTSISTPSSEDSSSSTATVTARIIYSSTIRNNNSSTITNNGTNIINNTITVTNSGTITTNNSTNTDLCINKPCGVGYCTIINSTEYNCTCHPGFEFETYNGTKTCRSLCAKGIYNGCNSGTCQNTTRTCVCGNLSSGDNCEICNDGYRRNLVNQNCEDINECDSNIRDKCPSRGNILCTNKPGDYGCNCAPKFFNVNNTCQFPSLYVVVVLKFNDLEFIPDYLNATSQPYTDLSDAIEKAIEREVNLTDTFPVKVKVSKFSPGSLLSEVVISSASNSAANVTVDRIQATLVCNTSICLGLNSSLDISSIHRETICNQSVCPPSTSCTLNPTPTQPNFYTCSCIEGWKTQGTAQITEAGSITDICTDVDECQESTVCGTGNCTNTAGGYNCQCGSHHIYNGTTCIESRACDSNQCSHGTCNTVYLDYICQCNTLYSGKNCDDATSLVLVILLCIFLVLTILLLFYIFKTNGKLGKKNITSSTVAWSSTEGVDIDNDYRLHSYRTRLQ